MRDVEKTNNNNNPFFSLTKCSHSDLYTSHSDLDLDGNTGDGINVRNLLILSDVYNR